MGNSDEVRIQRQYYAGSAHKYEEMHVGEGDEHFFALAFLGATLRQLDIHSILDIGSGTGRAVRYLKKHHPDLKVVGLEPVKELRQIGYSLGLSESELIDGDATKLSFDTSEFDLVCEFGLLHHVPRPEVAVAEMLRVARKAIFISDSNNFGQGSPAIRLIKQLINRFGLWGFANFLKTKGKGYSISEGDGLAYSYSVFNNYDQIKSQCTRVHLLNTRDGAINPYATASHVALLGIKR